MLQDCRVPEEVVFSLGLCVQAYLVRQGLLTAENSPPGLARLDWKMAGLLQEQLSPPQTVLSFWGETC